MTALTNSYTATSFIEASRPNHTLLSGIRRYPDPSPSITVYTSDSSFNAHIFKSLKDIFLLKDDWDGDSAKRPSKLAMQHAQFVTNLLSSSGQQIFHAAPGPNGEILIEIRNQKKQKSIEIIFYETKSVYVTFFDQEKPVQGKFEFKLLPILLESLNQ